MSKGDDVTAFGCVLAMAMLGLAWLGLLIWLVLEAIGWLSRN